MKCSTEKPKSLCLTHFLGDHCRTRWKEDGRTYEGTILSVEPSDGYFYATVEFVGFGNHETAWFNEMIPSLGEGSRKAQEKEALGETPENPATNEKESNGELHSPSSSPVEDLTGITWKENARCRAVYKADGQAYEATLKEIYPKTGEGKIHFIGMNADQVMPLKELQKV